MENFKVGTKVNANITKNGFIINVYEGTVVGHTKNGRVKVKSYRGVKCHAIHNLVIL